MSADLVKSTFLIGDNSISVEEIIEKDLQILHAHSIGNI